MLTSGKMRILKPGYGINSYFLEKYTSLASNRVHISLTDGTINNVIVSNYSNLDELKDALICSCYLPGFSSWKQVPNYKNKPYLDGGFSNNQPVLQEDCTLRYSH